MHSSINILSSQHIDRIKWDDCIRRYGLIYSSSGYLDIMAANWHGIVVDDYKAVMPLPWKRKLVRYIYTPPYIQQLGITGNVDKRAAEEIRKMLAGFARYGDYHFNFSDQPMVSLLPVASMTNLVMDLSQEYTFIRQRYDKDVIVAATAAVEKGLSYTTGTHTDAIQLYRDLYGRRTPHVSSADHRHFTRLCDLLEKKDACFTRQVTTSGGEIASIAVLLQDDRRIYNILNASTAEGRSLHSNYFLYDRLFHEFSGSYKIFDFEGSNIPGIQHFYEKLGGEPQPYFFYHYNDLPKWLRLVKT